MQSPSAVRHLYLSPHLDDVVLSCGATVYQQTAAGDRVLVITFFAGSPVDDEVSEFTRELRERWGGASDPVADRRAEDAEALGALGAGHVHWPHLDCVYRREPSTQAPLYPTEASIFGDVHSSERTWHKRLAEEILAVLAPSACCEVYAPVAAGHHVDHLIVRAVGLALAARGRQGLFYEDYPYAREAETVAMALGNWPSHMRCRVQVAFGEDALRAKGDAVACYRSQISTFWANEAEMRRSLWRDALAAGEGVLAELCWRLAQARGRTADDPLDTPRA